MFQFLFSSEHNSLDYFLWGYVKEFIYKNPMEEQFHCAIGDITPEMQQLTQQSLVRTYTIQMGDLHFEHFLYNKCVNYI